MFSYSPPVNSQSDLRFIIVVLLIWLPAFGWMPDHSITFEVMKISAVLVILLTLFVWINKIQTKSSKAWVYLAILVTPMFLTAVIFFVRYVELLVYTFSLPVEQVILWALVVALVSVRQLYTTYLAEQTKLRMLRQRGLLGKYKIFKEEEALWKISNYYPGVDGSTPEEEAKKDQQRWGCLSLIPISGVTFYLIRTTQGSVAWLLLLMFLFAYFSFLFIGIKILSVLLQLRRWERELGRAIYTDIEKQDEE